MNNKRIPKSDVINKIISRINDMYPYADPEKIKKCFALKYLRDMHYKKMIFFSLGGFCLS